ncbi:MAG: exostosin family protein [Patescibacteria group bacterium]|nr:exostosin family protein [Patescibacteria group bacterium]
MTDTTKLSLYVDPAWRRAGAHHTPLLNPWWGNPYGEESLFAKQMFDAYSCDTDYYTVTDDVRKADLVLAPYRQNWLLRFDKTLLATCISTARANGRPLLVDGSGDIEESINDTDIYVLRYGGYRFIHEPGRIQIPLYVDDLLERCRGGTLDIRKKGPGKPVVGFAGWAKLSPAQRARTIIKELPVRLRSIFDSRLRACTKGVLWREKAIGILKRSPQVTLSLRTRGSFSANTRTAEGDLRTLQEEMVGTILGSDYALDVRGDANNAARLFEILSLGRIPVIVDTERIFPFADKVDYSSFALIVDSRDLGRLPERIAEFHGRISPERFEEMQRNAREAFVRFFRIDAIMRSVVPDLRARLAAREC